MATNIESENSGQFSLVGRNVFAKNCVSSVDCSSTIMDGFDEELMMAAVWHWYQEKENYDFGQGF